MLNVPFWYPKREYQVLKHEIDAAVQKVQTDSDLVRGDELERFEKRMAQHVGTKHFVGVGSGTDALTLSLRATGIQPGDEVIVPSYTFRATVDAVCHVGAKPVIADYGEDWSHYWTDKTTAIIPVHIAGEIMDWRPEGNVLMIEDACQAIGAAQVKGVTACYSFYPAKILGCHGQGGGIATNNHWIAEDLRAMSNLYKGRGESLGYNSRLDNLQAAILNVKLDHLDDSIRRRKEVAEKYDQELATLVKIPTPRKVYQDYIIETKFAPGLFHFLNEKGIETLANEYKFPDDYPKGPKTLAYEAQTLRLPCHPFLSDQEVNYVIGGVRQFFSELKI